jgi:hypothetical protein
LFGLLREAGGYRIIAAGPTEGGVRRALEGQTNPTLIVTREDLPSVGISEREWRAWLPAPAAGPEGGQDVQGTQGRQDVQGSHQARGGQEGRA